MGMRTLRIAAVAALVWTGIARAECVSLMREASSGVFNRITAGVAWSGTVLGVAKVDVSGARDILFATYSEDLVQLTGDQLVGSGSFNGVTALLWNGRDFAVFYEDSRGQLLLQRVSTSGQPVGGPVAIAPNHPLSTEREYDVTWDPVRQLYAVVHSVLAGDKGLFLALADRDGGLRSETVITALIAPPLRPKVAANNSGGIGVLFWRNGIVSTRIFDATGSGSVIEPVMNARDARIASDGTSFVVVGNAPVNAPTEIDWTVVDTAGKIAMPATKLFAKGAEIQPVSLFWNAARSEWALAYLTSLFPFSQVSGDYRLRRFTAAGDLISDSLFSPDPILSRLTTSLPFAWTGTSYVSAASRAASGTIPPDSYVVRHCPLTATIATSAPSVRAGTTVTFTAKVDGGVGSNTYAWTFGDGRTSSSEVAAIRFDKLGDYPITLQVTDSAGANSVTSMTLHVVAPRRRAVKH
jgi:PKD domain-containing protein